MQYSINNQGILIEAQFPNIPGFGIQVPLNGVELDEVLTPKSGYVWILKDDTPVQVKDNRGNYYVKTTGEPVEFNELGDAPDTLTKKEPCSPFDKWDGKKWVKDEVAEAEANRAAIPAITRRQARLKLLDLGLLEKVEALVYGQDNKALAIEYETDKFERGSPLFDQIGLSFDLNDEAIDSLFIEAAKL